MSETAERYREVFRAVIGQQAAASMLRRDLERSQGSGSTLILGPEGVGRFRMALSAARAILGTNDASDHRVRAGTHPDLHVLEPEAGIAGIREALPKLQRRPAEGPRSVLILRDADRLSTAALNALLKTLEEPPADAAVFVIAEGAGFLPETVASRCRRVRLGPLREAELLQVLEREGIDAAGAADAEGSPGRARYQHEESIGEAATALLALLRGGVPDPLGAVEKIQRRRPGEESADHRRRISEILRVCAARLRKELPAQEAALRSVVETLGSVRSHGNSLILFSHLVLEAGGST